MIEYIWLGSSNEDLFGFHIMNVLCVSIILVDILVVGHFNHNFDSLFLVIFVAWVNFPPLVLVL